MYVASSLFRKYEKRFSIKVLLFLLFPLPTDAVYSNSLWTYIQEYFAVCNYGMPCATG